MTRFNFMQPIAPDQSPIFVVRRDFTGGINSRQHPSRLADNQVEYIENLDLSIPGQLKKRDGSSLIADELAGTTITALHNYIREGTNSLICYEDVNVREWTGSGNWSSEIEDGALPGFTADQTDIGMVNIKKSGITPDDVFVVQNGTDNAMEFHKATAGTWTVEDLGSTAGTGSDSPPKSTVMAWYGNRLWVLTNDLFYFSAAYSSDYSTAFDTVSDVFRIPVGTERGIVPTRDTGMIIMGKEAIWGLAPSVIPVATDKPEPIITNRGVVSKKGWVNAGDDIYFFSQDGFRALRRTVQDKLQAGIDYPISYALKTEFERINWAYIDKLSMETWDNKIFISIPTGASTFDTWIYYLPTNSFSVTTGWSPRCWSKYTVSNKENLYYGSLSEGKVFRASYGQFDEGDDTASGTTIKTDFQSKEEDFGQPLIDKQGGEIEIEASSTGSDATLTIYVALDGKAYQELGTIALQSETAPVLPVVLPFSLSDTYIIRQKFHLESLGSFRTIQIRITNADDNTDDIVIYGYQIITFAEEYKNE